jgi:preprotein translocase subunit SecA
VFADIEDCYKRGQPVLVGTISVEKSEVLASLLRSKDIPFNVLNAKQHMREAGVVAQAGRKGSVTISTNMAGRGTDILLGGNPEFMAKEAVAAERAQIADDAAAAEPAQPSEGQEGVEGDGPYRGSTQPAFDEEERFQHHLKLFKAQCDAEKQEVLKAGGLKIVGTERHESRRIDNQLRGRAGRQGDPGVSRFYLSLEDDLLRIFGLDKMAGLMERLGLEEDTPIESPMVTRSIEGAQKKVEGRNFDTRKNVLEYDDVMNQQRKTIYALRRQILEGRYAPELSEDEKKKGLEPTPPTVSGEWTIEKLSVEMLAPLTKLVEDILARVAARDAAVAIGTPNQDPRPGWRILRAEVWRTWGAMLDLEKKFELPKAELIDFIVAGISASLIQQRERVYDLADGLIGGAIDTYCPATAAEDEWNFEGLVEGLREQFNTSFEDLPPRGTREELAEAAWKKVQERLDEREKELTRPWMFYFARHFALEEIDAQWIDHLKVMDQLREGIGLRGYGQKDPKKEYKKEGYDLFGEMMARILSNACTKMFRVQIQREDADIPALQQKQRRMRAVHPAADGKGGDEAEGDEAAAAAGAGAGKPRRGGVRPAAAAAAGGGGGKVQTVRREQPKVGRNDPCPCGSGKKFKKCHGKEAEDAGAADA